jgi:hypothetical protein
MKVQIFVCWIWILDYQIFFKYNFFSVFFLIVFLLTKQDFYPRWHDVKHGSPFCFVVVLVVLGADTLIRILHYCTISPCFQHIAPKVSLHHMHCMQPCPAALARQPLPGSPCPAALARQPLPGSLARQPLPGSPCPAALARQPLPGSPCPAALARQPLPGSPCPTALQKYYKHAACSIAMLLQFIAIAFPTINKTCFISKIFRSKLKFI